MPSPLLVHNDAEPLVAFLLWCLAIHRAEQERKRKMHSVPVRLADWLLAVLMSAGFAFRLTTNYEQSFQTPHVQ
jgi:hypothetical protein